MSIKISSTEIQSAVAAALPAVQGLIADVGAHPEVGMKEFHACAVQKEYLAAQGFALAPELEVIPTAFQAEYRAVESDDAPRVGILTEYDALAAPLGHACGHQLIMGAGLLALAAVKDLMQKYSIPGTLRGIGCPAEEQQGGKLKLIKSGVFGSVDIALLSHPFFRSGVTKYLLAVTRYDVEFIGRSAHASTAPDAGINALDAMNLFFAGINAWRQQLPSTARVHGIITNGGQVANAIPEYTSAFFYVRSADNERQQFMEERFADIARGAALMTGCELKLTRQDNAYSAGGPNQALSELAEKLMDERNMDPERVIPEPLSSDIANVCDVVPGVNLYFNITNGEPIALHSEAFRNAAASPEALPKTVEIAGVIAELALTYLLDDEFRQSVKNSPQI